jgi:hypothetical protein
LVPADRSPATPLKFPSEQAVFHTLSTYHPTPGIQTIQLKLNPFKLTFCRIFLYGTEPQPHSLKAGYFVFSVPDTPPVTNSFRPERLRGERRGKRREGETWRGSRLLVAGVLPSLGIRLFGMLYVFTEQLCEQECPTACGGSWRVAIAGCGDGCFFDVVPRDGRSEVLLWPRYCCCRKSSGRWSWDWRAESKGGWLDEGLQERCVGGRRGPGAARVCVRV